MKATVSGWTGVRTKQVREEDDGTFTARFGTSRATVIEIGETGVFSQADLGEITPRAPRQTAAHTVPMLSPSERRQIAYERTQRVIRERAQAEAGQSQAANRRIIEMARDYDAERDWLNGSVTNNV